MTQKEVIARLDNITSDFNFIYVISLIMLRDFCSPLEEFGKRNAHEHLNYNEASFLIGLWIKNVKKIIRTEIDIQAKTKETYDLMEELHYSFLREGPKIKDAKGGVSEFMTNGFIFKEAFFYTATGAYDYQYAKKSALKYKYDENWLVENKGFNLITLNDFFKHVKDVIHLKLNSKERKTRGIKTSEDLLELFTLTHTELTNGIKEYENLVSNLTIELEQGFNAQLKLVGDYNEYQTKPIIKLNPNSFFIPMPFYIGEAIYESPFYWMMADKTYLPKAQENRGKVAEEIAFEILAPIFGPTKTFKGVLINENKSTSVTDIDVCGIYGNTAFIVQIKSKKLTALSKQGNIEKIKEDFKKAIEDAFIQGIECKKAIENADKYSFITKDGTNIQKELLGVCKTYIACIVLDVYPALTHSSHILLYDKHEESTICLSIFDLEVICRYLKNPKQLLDYFSKRIQNCRNYYADNELCFLGFYLKHDLKEIKGHNGVMIDSDYGSIIDGMYYPEIAGYTKGVKAQKVGRNEKCPCGSNLKYKHCHGKNNA